MVLTDWTTLGRTLLATFLAYVALLAALRLGGKRTLAQLNAFDWIVTVAIGTVMASVATSSSVSVAQGVTAFAVLILLQVTIALLSTRVGWFQRLIKARPTLLVRNGDLLHDGLRQARVSESEIYQALRQSGVGALEEVAAVILETNGRISVLRSAPEHSVVLTDVPAWSTGTATDR